MRRNGWTCRKIGTTPFPSFSSLSCKLSRFLASIPVDNKNDRAGNEPWTFSSEDIRVWERLFAYTLDKALDNGTDPDSVLEEIAATILEHHTPTWVSATRLVDLIIS